MHLFAVFINKTYSVKVNVEGTVSLGKDVMNALSQFLGKTHISGRRSMVPIIEEDPITVSVRAAVLCRNLGFCQRVSKFVEEFISILTMSFRRVLSDTLNDNFRDNVYEKQLEHYLEMVRYTLEDVNSKVSENTEIYYWMDTIKRICAKFQEMASIFVTDELQVDPKDINKIKEELNRKLVIASVLVEMKYITKLCAEYKICINSYRVTKSLNTVLKGFEMVPDYKVRLFLKYFYEALFDSPFYTHISEKSGHELQIILNDMAYSSEVPTKDLLSTVQKIVEARLEVIETNKDEKFSHDALLFHAILSNMDHIYSMHEKDPFNDFFQHFRDWLVDDIKVNRAVDQIVKDIGTELKPVSDDIIMKLTNEVRVFLEITVHLEK